MLLIPCPYCGMERPELEFRYGGEAHIARPQDPCAVSDEDWAEYLYFRSNPKGVLAERWRHVSGCGRFFNVPARHRQRQDPRVYKAGEPRPDIAPPGGRHDPGLPRRRRRLALDRARADLLHLRWRRLRRLRGRHARVRPPRQRRASRRALVQISPAARHPAAPARRSRTRSSASRAAPAASRPNLRATQVELYDGLVATSQNRWPTLRFDVGAINDVLAPLIGAGFYYKTFMGPDWFGQELGVEAGLRAGHPPRRRPRDRAPRARPGPLSSAPSIIATC